MAIIYKIQNKTNGKVYIGQSIHTLDWRLNNEYCGHFVRAFDEGSQGALHNALRKYGKEGFTYEIVEERTWESFEKPEDIRQWLDEREKYWISYYDSTDKNKGYNRTLGGSSGLGESQRGRAMTWGAKIWESRHKNGTDHPVPWNKGKTMPAEFREKMSENAKQRWEDDDYRNVMFTSEHCQRLSEAVKKQWEDDEQRKKKEEGLRKSWENNEERRKKVSELFSGPKTEEHRKNIGLASAGRKWVNNGVDYQTLTKDYQKYIDKGWKFGRLDTNDAKLIEGRRKANIGRRWINNGKINSFTKDHERLVKEGWTYGQI